MSAIMTIILNAQQSKNNWMNTHLKNCSRLIDKNFDTVRFGVSLIPGLTLYGRSTIDFLNH